MYKEVKEKFGDLIDAKRIDDAQGLEGRYYVIDINQNDYFEVKDSKGETHKVKKDLQQLRNEFYTAFTRAEIGGIIVSSMSVGQPIKVTSTQEESSTLEQISPESIKATSNKRKELFTHWRYQG
jgi:hypothetical protein